ncbi:MAG: xylose isomerase [Candidatus Marinimicrobia bacterium]|nr:xylose isomerase [Candidatus Neomarinimicrobiota bacterium]|tara:strand:- start:1480 stop:2394 length:915 start_codon:yes stop_codon:yes gene_type:complete
MEDLKRRDFIKKSIKIIGSVAFLNSTGLTSADKDRFSLSLAQWSLHRSLMSGKLDNLDFVKISKEKFDINAVEYVNTFFFKKAKNKSYLKEMKNRSNDFGVKNLLIMCDNEGRLGDSNAKKRKKAIENHFKWVEAANFLGCNTIRVNASSEGSWDEQKKLVVDGLSRLVEFAKDYSINVVVENHGGLSSNGKWLSEVISNVEDDFCGTLPDFGNFKIQTDENNKEIIYDRYKGVKELIPYAKAVSAKSYDFDENGDETTIDFYKMIEIVKSSKYKGYIGIEYEGDRLSEYDGILETKKLLEKLI